MARMPTVWWRSSHRQWFTRMHGKQIPLGVKDPHDEAAARAALKQLMREAAGEAFALRQASGSVRPGTIAELIPKFLDDRRPLVEPATLRGYAQHLKWLAGAFGGETAAGLGVGALVRAAARVEGWGDTHRANVLGTCVQLLKWAGRTEPVPLPPKASRGADSVIPEEVYLRMLDETRGDFRALTRFLWLTGCRPGEATGLTGDLVKWEAGTVRLKLHKTRKKGKHRVLYLAEEAVGVLRAQHAKYGDGLLFPGQRGRKLSLQAMTMRFERLSAKIGHRVTSYQFRHTWASRALLAGVPESQVAAMLGHTGTRMIASHYGHLDSFSQVLREQADRVNNHKKAG